MYTGDTLDIMKGFVNKIKNVLNFSLLGVEILSLDSSQDIVRVS